MIDLNVIKIFILIKLIQMSELMTKKKINEYKLFIIDESQLKIKIIKEIVFLLVAI